MDHFCPHGVFVISEILKISSLYFPNLNWMNPFDYYLILLAVKCSKPFLRVLSERRRMCHHPANGNLLNCWWYKDLQACPLQHLWKIGQRSGISLPLNLTLLFPPLSDRPALPRSSSTQTRWSQFLMWVGIFDSFWGSLWNVTFQRDIVNLMSDGTRAAHLNV